jgi:hypothetical protein
VGSIARSPSERVSIDLGLGFEYGSMCACVWWWEVIDLANVQCIPKGEFSRMNARLSKARLRRVRRAAEISLSQNVSCVGWTVLLVDRDSITLIWRNDRDWKNDRINCTKACPRAKIDDFR